ncbi:hypothetical protein [Rossellomorea aquimaris]|uniref:Uncharacterized protein n=1 Tax=Rossellomorea aquimaris TaxID=189382 RepID=A0A1J6VTM8_9BACI|nr:hypothetical protein [Rossellomorea aquimaris]OIU68629.1 hypothetical protein BHE18_17035 [Rossellomorea aquimaris]
MGKMNIHVTTNVILSEEYRNQPDKLQEEIDFILHKFGEIEEFRIEQDADGRLTVNTRLKAADLQVKLFEKWGQWEYARNLDRDMKMNFIGFGEVESCTSAVRDYEPTKRAFKNPLRSLFFFD